MAVGEPVERAPLYLRVVESADGDRSEIQTHGLQEQVLGRVSRLKGRRKAVTST